MLHWLYHAYRHSVPPHCGKGKLTCLLERSITGSNRSFLWRMEDGADVLLRPHEAIGSDGVGATCFHERRWEPHIRSMINRILRPGDVALDVGSNIGVFTVAMSRAVGESGRVYCFEPAAATFAQLQHTIDANG